MSDVESNRKATLRWFEEVWNQKRAETIDELMAAEIEGYGLTNDPAVVMRRPDDFKPYYHSFVSAIPDIRVEVEDTIAEGDKVAARCRVTGTHSGPGLGVLPTGRAVDFRGTVFLRFRDGRIVEGWNNFDFMTLFSQLGQLAKSASLPG